MMDLDTRIEDLAGRHAEVVGGGLDFSHWDLNTHERNVAIGLWAQGVPADGRESCASPTGLFP